MPNKSPLMRNILYALLVTLAVMTSCTTANTVLKSTDRDYKFEVAKQLYAEGKYSGASLLLDNILPSMRSTKSGDEALFLMGMCKYNTHDYETAAELLKRYYSRSYPTGMFVEDARYYAALSFFENTEQVRLDQTNTYLAIRELQNILEIDPQGKHSQDIQNLMFSLQDRLVEKEYLAAKLYFNLGDYFLNCTMGGSNYQACVTTSQNAIKDYPYSPRKEDFAILILKAKYELARSSVPAKQVERYNDAVDEYYGFINEFPQSLYTKEAKEIFDKSEHALNSSKLSPYKKADEES